MKFNVKKRIEDIYPSLGDQSKKLADYIIKEGSNLSSETVNDIAKKCNVSVATVSRLPQQLGYTNLAQLKWSLANEINESENISKIKDNDSPKTVAKKTFQSNIKALNNTFEMMSESDLFRAISLISKARTLGFFGLGGSNIAALDAYHKFLRLPINLVQNSEYHMALMQAARMTYKDCAIVISHTGDDTDTLLIAETLKNNSVPIIVITSFPDSPLSNYGTVKFFSISEDSKYRSEALLSLTSQLAINDCLYTLMSQYFGKSAESVLAKLHKPIFQKHLRSNSSTGGTGK